MISIIQSTRNLPRLLQIASRHNLAHPMSTMRYPPEHKVEVHQKIVEDASRRVRAEGLNGAAVAAVMRDTGLTHGGFYKHFESKDELLLESVSEAFRDIGDTLAKVALRSPPGDAWKAIVKTYLSQEFCDRPERGCPLPALAPELTRVDQKMSKRILPLLAGYRDRMLPFMPGRRTSDKERAFFAIFSAMAGAIEIARLLPEPAMREKVLTSVRDFLLSSF
jgi:TetR/AcrR family transcriptional regulator, transcriptional repressor for nem operon